MSRIWWCACMATLPWLRPAPKSKATNWERISADHTATLASGFDATDTGRRSATRQQLRSKPGRLELSSQGGNSSLLPCPLKGQMRGGSRGLFFFGSQQRRCNAQGFDLLLDLQQLLFFDP